MLRITLTRSLEGGPRVLVVLERSLPDATLRVEINDETTLGNVTGADLRNLEVALRSAVLSPLPTNAFGGLTDGTCLSIELGMTKANFEWSGSPPDGWAPLAAIVQEVLSLARSVHPSYALR